MMVGRWVMGACVCVCVCECGGVVEVGEVVLGNSPPLISTHLSGIQLVI